MIRNTCRLTAFALVASLGFLGSQSSYATDIEVDTSDGAGFVGAYYGLYDPNRDMPPPTYPPFSSPDIDPNGVQVYFMGRTSTAPLDTGFTTSERRVFFIFDMAGLSVPVGEVIDDVTISLELLPGGTSALANFTGGIEKIEFTSTPFGPPELLDPNSVPPSPDPNAPPIEIEIWETLGTGLPYGDFEIVDGATPPDVYEIPLPGAIPDIDAAITAGDFFIVSARLETFDPGPIGPTADSPTVPPIVPYEYVFGGTDIGSAVDAPLLIISTVPIPEPASLALGAFGVLLIGLRRRETC